MVTIGRYDALFPPDEAVLLLRGCAQPTAQNEPDRCGGHGAKRDRRRLPAGLATVIICSTGGLRGARRPARLLPILKPRLIPSRCACGRSGKVGGRSRYVGRALHVDYQVHPADGDGAEAGVRKGLLHHLGWSRSGALPPRPHRLPHHHRGSASVALPRVSPRSALGTPLNHIEKALLRLLAGLLDLIKLDFASSRGARRAPCAQRLWARSAHCLPPSSNHPSDPP